MSATSDPLRFTMPVHFAEAVSFPGNSFALPAGTVTNASIAALADIDYSKTQHAFPLVLSQANGSAVATETRMVHVARCAGALLSVEAVVTTAATGNATVTIDVQKSTGAAAFTELLDTVITLNSGVAAFTPEAGVVSGTNTYADGDILEFIVTATVGTGALPEGMGVTAFVYEESV